jgi:ABC-type multidrug transport system ATPase subunit
LTVRREIVAPWPSFGYHRTKAIERYTTPDSGSVPLLGLDLRKGGYELKERIGIMLQRASVHPHLKVGRLLRLSTGTP